LPAGDQPAIADPSTMTACRENYVKSSSD
jgi:hypothetical protein